MALALLVALAPAGCEGCFNFTDTDAGPSEDAGFALGDLVINELMSSNQSTAIVGTTGFPDWIEIRNRTGSAIALDGWQLGDASTLGAFVAGASVPAGAWLVVLANDAIDGGTPALPTFPFKLSGANGDTVTLLAPDGAVADRVSFGALGADQSFGRLPDGEGAPAVLPYTSPGRANDDPGEGEGEGEGECVPLEEAPPLILNEVEVENSATLVDGEYAPWFELHNASDAAVPLAGLRVADNLALDGAFALPDVSIAPRGFVLVVADEDGPTGGTIAHTTPGLLLSPLDDVLVLTDRCGTIWRTLLLDPSPAADTAWGLLPDGDESAGGRRLTAPTPGQPNQ
ncbi:MAG: lamin tail domain-containing protein [Deltaproteobacteria bacterium]|nr:lamin tail domain-containing protein [Deltaproteobacteria bacterium]